MTTQNPKPSPSTFFRASNEHIGPLATPAQAPVIPPAPMRQVGQPLLSIDSLGRDAILPGRERRIFTGRDTSWSEAAQRWLAAIDAELHADVETPFYRTPTATAPLGFFLRSTDGAFMRKTGGEPLAFQPGAWSQFISALGYGRGPRGGATTLAWLWPHLRSLAVAELRDRSTRPEGEGNEILLRTHIDPHTGLRALRAVLSGRHSGIHLDDRALCGAIAARIDPEAPAAISRGIDETHGWAGLADSFAEARASVHFRNSETGGAQLAFSAGCYISVLDTTVRRATMFGDEIAEERRVVLASEQGRTRRNHTLPRRNTSEARRAAVARERMLGDFDKASAAARELARAWLTARADVSPMGPIAPAGLDRAACAEVLADGIEEHSRIRLTAEDRARIVAVLTSEDRLEDLPWGTSAHVAGAFACAARDAGDVDETLRLQHLASEWVLSGWSRNGNSAR